MGKRDERKRVSFLCPPKLLTYIKASHRACNRDQSNQITYLLELALDLREHDWDVQRFQSWLRAYQGKETQHVAEPGQTRQPWLRLVK